MTGHTQNWEQTIRSRKKQRKKKKNNATNHLTDISLSLFKSQPTNQPTTPNHQTLIGILSFSDILSIEKIIDKQRRSSAQISIIDKQFSATATLLLK